MEHSMRDEVKGFHLRKRRAAGATSARDADNRTMRPPTADTLVAHEERVKSSVLDPIYYSERGLTWQRNQNQDCRWETPQIRQHQDH